MSPAKWRPFCLGHNVLRQQKRVAETKNEVNIGSSYSIYKYCKTSNIRRTLVGNKIVDHSDVVGASPVGAAPTTSSFST